MATHKQLANWYTLLANHIDAGISLPEALTMTEGVPSAGRFEMVELLEAGASIEETLQQAPRWLPETDRIFISAAAETGQFPQTFLNLAERHKRLAATHAKVILSLVYPIGVLHIAALALPLIKMIDPDVGFDWQIGTYLLMVAAVLIPLWATIGLIVLLVKMQHPSLPGIVRCIPILSKYSRLQAIANFADSLSSFLEAGLPISSAWEGAVHISNYPRLRKAFEQIRPVFNRGEDPATLLANHAIFPHDLIAYYKAGNQSGKLDITLRKAGIQFQNQANQALNLTAIVYPTLIFALVAGYIVYSIFQVYGGYLSNITDILP